MLVAALRVRTRDPGRCMADPILKREGNLRFVGTASRGYPHDPEDLVDAVKRRLTGLDVRCYGPPALLFSVPPEGRPEEWECQVGTAMVGLPNAPEGVTIEDFSGLYALTISHTGSILALADAHRRVSDHGRSLGYRIRPYWRLALWRRRLADGNCLPSAEVSVFLDK